MASNSHPLLVCEEYVATACFRFYEALNDFLPPEWRKVTFCHTFDHQASVKEMIESFGVPHTEVDLILVDGESVDFSHRVADGERISVYPLFESLDISPLQRLRPEPLREPGFVVDANLGRLAKYLRLLGFDALYRNDYDDATVAAISATEKRILLTRDRRLLQRKIITHGYFVRADAPQQQLQEVVRRFDLESRIRLFSRCTRCNGTLAPVEKREIESQLQPRTRRYYDEFLRCRGCGQIYWRGSHHERALTLLEALGLRA